MSKRWTILKVGLLGVILAACGGNSGIGLSPSATVLAEASGYSDATVTGVYAVTMNGLFLAAGGYLYPFDFSASLSADGNGNFTTGTLTESIASNSGGSSCSGTVAGTYNIGASGTGSAVLTFTPAPNSVCSVTTTTYSIAANAAGALVFAESDGTGQSSGSAIRQ